MYDEKPVRYHGPRGPDPKITKEEEKQFKWWKSAFEEQEKIAKEDAENMTDDMLIHYVTFVKDFRDKLIEDDNYLFDMPNELLLQRVREIEALIKICNYACPEQQLDLYRIQGVINKATISWVDDVEEAVASKVNLLKHSDQIDPYHIVNSVRKMWSSKS